MARSSARSTNRRPQARSRTGRFLLLPTTITTIRCQRTAALSANLRFDLGMSGQLKMKLCLGRGLRQSGRPAAIKTTASQASASAWLSKPCASRNARAKALSGRSRRQPRLRRRSRTFKFNRWCPRGLASRLKDRGRSRKACRATASRSQPRRCDRRGLALRDSASRQVLPQAPAASRALAWRLCAQHSVSHASAVAIRTDGARRFRRDAAHSGFCRPCAAKTSRLLVKAPRASCAMDAPANHRRRQAPPCERDRVIILDGASADANCACQTPSLSRSADRRKG